MLTPELEAARDAARRRLDDPAFAQAILELYSVVQLAMESSAPEINAFGMLICARIGRLLYGDARLSQFSPEELSFILSEARECFDIPEREPSVQ